MFSLRALALVTAVLPEIAGAQWINFNFYNSAGTPAPENAALLTGPFGGLGEVWNQGNGTSGAALLDASGAATTVGFTVPTANRWNWGDPALKLIKGGAAQFTKGADTVFTITGLTPGGRYDVCLGSYAHNTAVAERAAGAWTTPNASATAGPRVIDCRTKLNGDSWEAGINHVRFENVEANAGGAIVFNGDAWDLTAGAGDEWRLPLNGFQIKPAAPVVPPEPLEITGLWYDPGTDQVSLAWKSTAGETYGVYWSAEPAGFTLHGVHHAVAAQAATNRTTAGPFANPIPGAGRMMFRVGPPDLSNPQAQAHGSGTTVTIAFSEAIHPRSAENAGNFDVTINGTAVTVLAAVLDPGGRNILLTLAAPMPAGASCSVTARNITTLAGRVIPTAFQAAFQTWDNDPDGVQVFVLAGQSNMVGHGKTETGHGDVPGAIGCLRYQVNNDPANYGHLVNGDGTWRVRGDVKVWWRDSDLTAPRAVIKGDLKIGYAQSRNPEWIGPEFAFGWAVGEHFTDKPVLLIKTAWGGKSLHTDFRPPSAVAARGGVVGPYYTGMIAYVRDCLSNLGGEFPEFAGMRYRIAGVGWHQGWNDRVDETASANYEANLADLIRDLRVEFGNPGLPVSITTTGMAPPPEYTAVELAQLAMADAQKHPQFAGNVRVTDTRPFWREESISPSGFGYHWNHNGESQFLNGKAMGDRMVEMLGP